MKLYEVKAIFEYANVNEIPLYTAGEMSPVAKNDRGLHQTKHSFKEQTTWSKSPG